MKQTNLFTIPIWTKRVDNFQEKKDKLIHEFDKFADIKDQSNNFTCRLEEDLSEYLLDY